MSRSGLALTLVTLAGVAHPEPVKAWCYLPKRWDATATLIPVRLNLNMGDICGPNGGEADCEDFADVERTVRVAIDEFNDSAGSKIRFFYEGTTNANEGDILNGKIHIYADPNLVGPGGKGEGLDMDVDGDYDSCRVMVNVISWAFVAMDTDFGMSGYFTGLHGLLLHELGHCIGLKHIDECPDPTPKSMMHDGTQDKNHLFRDDIAAVQSWGLRSDTARVRQSSNLTTWTTGPTGPSQAAQARTRYGVTSYGTAYSYQAFPRDDLNFDRVRLTRYNGTSWTYVTVLPTTVSSTYHVGIATPSSASSELVVSYLGNYDATTGLQDVMLVQSTNSGTSWASPVQLTNVDQRSHAAGVTMSYDPVTDTYIILWRRSHVDDVYQHDEIVQAVWRRSDSTWDIHSVQWPAGTNLRSADSPAIACAPSSVVGAENCLFTWTTHQWDHFFYWVHGHVLCTPAIGGIDCAFVFNPASVFANPRVVYGQPAVTYTHNTTWPWLLAYHQGGTTVYTIRKGVSGDWTGETSHTASGYAVSPVVGAKSSSSAAHLFWHGSN